MNDLHKSLLIALCLIAFTAVIFFLKYGQQKSQSEMLERKTQESAMKLSDIDERAKAAMRQATEAEKSSLDARKKAQENLEKAKTAASMLEKMQKESALTKKEIVDRLNAQLEREADARIAAENASIELAKQRDILMKAAEETRKAYEELRASKTVKAGEDINRIKKMLIEKDAEIARLKENQEELEALRRLAETMQLETERRIADEGGEVEIPTVKRLRSPNLRMSH